MYGSEQKTKTLIFTAVFTALIAVGGWISVPLFAVPFTLQTLGVLLAASVMKRYAVLPAALYVLLGTLGLPIFHNGTAGLGVLLGPTGGFLLGFIAMAFVAGLFFEKGKLSADITGLVLAPLISYAAGIGWFWFSTGSGFAAALAACMIPFLPGDLIKSAAAEIVTLRRRKAGKRND
ncbi:MAG: biotin transporter BioY [Methanocorpusculum sp.]|nr:biotin transporter BioY [Methanocorpusculum sp.]